MLPRILLCRHPRTEWLQLLVCFRRQLPQHRLVGLLAQRINERCVELPQAIDQRVARVAADALRFRARRIQFADNGVEHHVERPIRSAAKRRQSCDDALEMCWQARARTFSLRASRIGRTDADGAPPFVEYVEDIVFAELDRNWPRARILRPP